MFQEQQSPLRLESGLRRGNVLRDEVREQWGQVSGWQQPGRLGSRGSLVGMRWEATAPEQSVTWPDLGLGVLPCRVEDRLGGGGESWSPARRVAVIQGRGQRSWWLGPGRGSGGV